MRSAAEILALLFPLRTEKLGSRKGLVVSSQLPLLSQEL